jgi:hypothetical protein
MAAHGDARHALWWFTTTPEGDVHVERAVFLRDLSFRWWRDGTACAGDPPLGLERLWVRAADACAAVVTTTTDAVSGWRSVALRVPDGAPISAPHRWWYHPQIGDDCFLGRCPAEDSPVTLMPLDDGVRNLPHDVALIRALVRTLQHVLTCLAATADNTDLAVRLVNPPLDATTPLPHEKARLARLQAAYEAHTPSAVLAMQLQLPAFRPVVPMASAAHARAALAVLAARAANEERS